MPTPPANEILTVEELAEYLRVHKSSIYKMLRRGKLPGFRVGSDWRFRRAAIDRWSEETRADAAKVA